MRKYLFIAVVLSSLAGTASGYTRIRLFPDGMPRWSGMPVPYWINESGMHQIVNGSEFHAAHAAFQTWQNVSSADIQFEYRGTTLAPGVGFDGMNVVSFADDSAPLGTSTVAATFSFFVRDSGGTAFQEADIIVNPDRRFSTSGESGKFDIQGVLTHEIGHMLGLDHAGLVSSVMAPFAAASVIHQRTLMYDDIAGVMEIYPRMSVLPASGEIRGVVRKMGDPVNGAHVVAVASDGTALVSALTEVDGSYVIRFLPPGIYRVYAEPLDLPVSRDHIGRSALFDTDFGTTYFGNVSSQAEAGTVQVTIGAAVSADIQALPPGPGGLNLTTPSIGIRLPRGSDGRLTIGGQDLTPGVTFGASSPSVILGSPSFGGAITSSAPASASMDLTVLPSAGLGPKNISAGRNDVTSIVSGAFVVTDAPPSNIQIGPESGTSRGGTLVTITGSHFRPGAWVYVGGLPAADVRVADSGTIHAATPHNAPGPAIVQVINADGTAGSASQTFAYAAEPPLITGVFPLSGAPAASVTIEGRNFDARPQNLEVRFNGTPARIGRMTATSIETAVPYGATSGPITLTVAGVTAIGPQFAVMPAVPGANVAPDFYNFIDAAPASGGTKLEFNNSDDAIALVRLPFNFSLFRDVYLADSQIAVSTNGWLSLAPGVIPEHQNSPLPASTVTRTGSGTPGLVPPALISPFWDDLILKSGTSAVSVRTVGNAPNRQFVVQWSGMSILDETGADLDASLTFQAILFEGSHDVQFVYQSLSGPRSDASSATIGMQDLARTQAVQTGFNQQVVRSGTFIAYRFQEGTYSAVVRGASTLARPAVIDGGAVTRNATELFASWTMEPGPPDVREFQYAIGTTPGGTDVRPFTSTTHNSAVVTGLNLRSGMTYYFAVRAVSDESVVSETGVSDGIRVDPAFEPAITVLPWSPTSNREFSQIALLAPSPGPGGGSGAMFVVLKAIDANGNIVIGPGIRNPSTIHLSAGEKHAPMLSEIFGIESFQGWVEIEASAAGLGVYVVLGSRDLHEMDGMTAGGLSSDFVLFHAGAAVLVNPSAQAATVTVAELGTRRRYLLTIPGRTQFTTNLARPARIQSTEPLAAVQRTGAEGNLAMTPAAPFRAGQQDLVFPQVVIGGGFSTTLTLVNASGPPREITITFGGVSRTMTLRGLGTSTLPLASFLHLSTDELQAGAARVTGKGLSGSGGLLGVAVIENSSGLAAYHAPHPITEAALAHVIHGNGVYTGIAVATGSNAANVVIDVYPGGGTPESAAFSMGPDQQMAAVLNELVSGLTSQVGGYIQVRSDQPVWVWGAFGSAEMMASAPLLTRSEN